jgi:ribonucleoside-triphosphate reductase
MLCIVKRDGTSVPFDKQKITDAINKAFIEVDGTLYEDDTANDIADEIKYKVKTSKDAVSVENIQDWIENYLMEAERKDVARAYIRYRYKKEVARGVKADFFDAIGEKLSASNIQNQNANVDEASFGGRIGEASSVMTKQYALDYIVSDMARRNHLNNEIYIHDLDSYAVGMHNCLSIPFDKLLEKGFNTRQTDVRPANSVNTALQLVAVIFQLQSLQQFGGVSATHLDWTLVPYVRKSFYKHYIDGLKYIDSAAAGHEIKLAISNDEAKDISIEDLRIYNHTMAYNYAMDMTQREIHQGVEGLYHNLNTLQSRSGN